MKKKKKLLSLTFFYVYTKLLNTKTNTVEKIKLKNIHSRH